MSKQQSEIVVAAQKVAKAEAKRTKVQKDYADKLAAAADAVDAARAELSALVVQSGSPHSIGQ